MSTPHDQALRKVISYIEDNHLLTDVSSVVVGLSGGVDSVVLLHMLSLICKRRGISLHAFHVHHGIRGDEADRDLDFCRELTSRMGIEFSFALVDVPSVAATRKQGLEEVARDLRYEALENYRISVGADRIAVAHHANDNLETLIFNIARGSAAKGGTGIPPIRGRLIRPMLSLTRDDIANYAVEHDLLFVTDSTNSDENYTRNFIRGQIVPLLEKINPSVTVAASGFCDALRADCEYLDRVAMMHTDEDDCATLVLLDRAILSRVIEYKYMRASGGERLSSKNLRAVSELINKNIDQSRLSLPCSVSALIDRGKLLFIRDYRTKEVKQYEIKLCFGENYIPETDAYIYLWKGNDPAAENSIKQKQNIYKLSIQKSFASDKISIGNLSARSRLDGDKIRIGNMTRKVKKLLCDSKMDRDLRAILPIITDESGILWIPSFPSRDGILPTNGCETITICVLMQRYTAI